jgi:hypothetical protein
VNQYGPLPSARLALDWQSGSFGLRASSTLFVGNAAERFDVLGASWALVERDGFRFGPFLSLAQYTGSSPIDHRITARTGLALDAGGENWRFDATVSAVGLAWYPRGEVETPLYRLSVLETMAFATELGVRRSLGQHQIRLGLLGPMPVVGYRFEGEPWLVRVDAGGANGTQTLWLQLGQRL